MMKAAGQGRVQHGTTRPVPTSPSLDLSRQGTLDDFRQVSACERPCLNV